MDFDYFLFYIDDIDILKFLEETSICACVMCVGLWNLKVFSNANFEGNFNSSKSTLDFCSPSKARCLLGCLDCRNVCRCHSRS